MTLTLDPSPHHPADADASLTERIVAAVARWATSQVDLVLLAAELCDSPDWILSGASTPAQHLAALADVEACTAREWIRVGKRVRGLPTISAMFVDGRLSYSKVRALISIATPANEAELAELALGCPAGRLRMELARWLRKNSDPGDLDAYHHAQRSVKWRNEPDGTITFTIRLPPHLAAKLIAVLTTLVMRARPRREPSGAWPTVAQQHADAFIDVLDEGVGEITTELVLHLRGDGATCEDGTPITDTIIARIIPTAFIRALIHDAQGRPINASGRRRHPSTRQKRVVKERDRACIDCGRTELLQYDHNPPYQHTGHTVVDELELRCAPCHQRRHHHD